MKEPRATNTLEAFVETFISSEGTPYFDETKFEPLAAEYSVSPIALQLHARACGGIVKYSDLCVTTVTELIDSIGEFEIEPYPGPCAKLMSSDAWDYAFLVVINGAFAGYVLWWTYGVGSRPIARSVSEFTTILSGFLTRLKKDTGEHITLEEWSRIPTAFSREDRATVELNYALAALENARRPVVGEYPLGFRTASWLLSKEELYRLKPFFFMDEYYRHIIIERLKLDGSGGTPLLAVWEEELDSYLIRLCDLLAREGIDAEPSAEIKSAITIYRSRRDIGQSLVIGITGTWGISDLEKVRILKRRIAEADLDI